MTEPVATKPKLQITATFTAEPLEDALSHWISELKLNLEIGFSPYNQVFQELLNPASALSTLTVGANVVLLRLEDWVRFIGQDPAAQPKIIFENTSQLLSVLPQAASRSRVPLLVFVVPGPEPDPKKAALNIALQTSANRLRSGLENCPNISYFGAEEILESVLIGEIHDQAADEEGHIPYTPEFFAALGTFIVRRYHCLTRPPYKVLALDADNTLWGGVCGEAGAVGLNFDEPYLALQRFALRQKERGMLLALCSKNVELDVTEAFSTRAEMLLSREDFVGWKVNWEPKSANLRSLANELKLGLDSFIYLDDNPAEIAEVSLACPEILALALPNDPAKFEDFIENIWAFDRGKATEEDGTRSLQYQQESQRQAVAAEAGSYADFIESLKIRVEVIPSKPELLARMAQLTQRTNQFNFATKRFTDGEMSIWLARPGNHALVFRVSDKFGDYGNTGLLMYSVGGGKMLVENFLVSCRVLGKGVEHQMLAHLGVEARKLNCREIEIPFLPTEKNQPVVAFLKTALRVETKGESGKLTGRMIRMPSQVAEGVKFDPSVVTTQAPSQAPAAVSQRASSALFAKIASGLADPSSVLAAINNKLRKQRPALSTQFAQANDSYEKKLAEIWQEVLLVTGVGIQDNFFDLGGQSILATRLVSRVLDAFNVRLTLRAILDRPTIRQQAQLIRETLEPKTEPAPIQASTPVGSPTTNPVVIPSAKKEAKSPKISPLPQSTPTVLSSPQERLWFLEQFTAGLSAYNIPLAFELAGSLDRKALENAFRRLADRHTILRSVYPDVEGRAQVQTLPSGALDFHFQELLDKGAPWQAEHTPGLLADFAKRSFDLATGSLLRVFLLQLAPDRHILAVNIHHIIADGWSMSVLVQEIKELYQAEVTGTPAKLTELTVQYADFAHWQRKRLGESRLLADLAYWTKQVAGMPDLLELPTDFRRPTSVTYHGGVVRRELPAALSASVDASARSSQTTAFTVLLAAFQALLHRYSRQEDFAVGTPISGRVSQEVEPLLGCFVNTLVLRARPSVHKSFEDFLTETRETFLDAQAHQELPFDQLIEKLGLARNLSHTPLFQVIFVLQNAGSQELDLYNLRSKPLPIHNGGAKYDLVLEATPTSDGYKLALEYNSELFLPETAERMLAHYETLLTAACANPKLQLGELRLMGQEEQSAILREPNRGERSFPPGKTIPQLFDEQAAATPDAIALTCESELVTYRELAERSNRLAHWLAKRGVGPDVLVGICMERSVDLLVGILGTLKAGGAYLPIDLSYPPERLGFMLEDASAPVLLTQEKLLSRLPESNATVLSLDSISKEDLWMRLPTTPPPCEATPDNLAYVIFTSGSTGKPKGALITHHNVVRLLQATDHWFGFKDSDVWTLFHSYAFDFSVWEIWGALLYGGRLVIVPHAVSRSPEDFLQLLSREKVSVLNQTPSAFRQLMEADQAASLPLALRYVIFGGEALEMHTLKPWFDRHGDTSPKLINMYGITETTVHVTYRPISAKDLVGGSVIGEVIPDLRIHILDDHQQPLPIGIPGEMYVGGAGLARGYLNRLQLTSERFIRDPFSQDPKVRLYRTGDLARFLPNYDIEYLGRIDQQVKIRGFRVELGEIEAILSREVGVKQALVIAREDVPGDKRLAAYIVAHASRPSVESLRKALQAKLPDYMVPSGFVFLNAIPLTANGKLDRKALPVPEVERSSSDDLALPTTATEKLLARIWSQVLRVEKVGRHDNFFALGGDSILSIQIISKSRAAGFPLSPKHLFENQTIASLAEVADRLKQPEPVKVAPSSPSPAATVVEPTVDTSPLKQKMPSGQVSIAASGMAEPGITSAEKSQSDLHAGGFALTPIQRWFFEQRLEGQDYWNQAFLFTTPEGMDADALSDALGLLVARHPALRLRFREENGEWTQECSPQSSGQWLRIVDLSHVAPDALARQITSIATNTQSKLGIRDGRLVRAVYFDLGEGNPGRLFLAIHHLAVDGVSWRILLEDLETAYEAALIQEKPNFAPKTAEFSDWSHALMRHARNAGVHEQRDYWRKIAAESASAASFASELDQPGENSEASAQSIDISLSAEETQSLLTTCHSAYQTQMNDLLLAALANALATHSGKSRLRLDMEGHGREDIGENLDLSRSIGWFTSIYPVLLQLPSTSSLGESIKAVKEQLRRIPNRGMDFGVLRYLGKEDLGADASLIFNYLGRLDQTTAGLKYFSFAPEETGPWHSPTAKRRYAIEVDASVREGRLGIQWRFSRNLHRLETIQALAEAYASSLRAIISHCLDGHRAPASADFPLVEVDQATIDQLNGGSRKLEDVLPLSPMQTLFHGIGATKPHHEFDQWHAILRGPLNVSAFQAAWREVYLRHPILRSSFFSQGRAEPLQAVDRQANLPWEFRDWTSYTKEQQVEGRRQLLRHDKQTAHSLADPPLCRFRLYKLGEQEFFFLWSLPDLLMDGWSWPVIFREVSRIYGQFVKGERPNIPAVKPYREYLAWLATRSEVESEEFWRRELVGITKPTPLPLDRPGKKLGRVQVVDVSLSPDATRALMTTARQAHVGLGAMLQAAWALLLSKTSGQKEVLFGSAFSGRPAELEGVESIVGPFTNNLPVRVQVDESATVADLVKKVQERLLAINSHQFSAISQIQDWSELPWKDRPFESLLVFQNYQVDDEARRLGADVAITEFTGPVHNSYPLLLMAEPGDSLKLSLNYGDGRCTTARAQAIVDNLTKVLDRLAQGGQMHLKDVLGVIELPKTEVLAETRPNSIVAPRTSVEEQIAGIWKQAFGLERVGIDENFFDLGGHSLLMVRVHAKLKADLGRDLSIVELFQFPTIRSLAHHLTGETVLDPEPAPVPAEAVIAAETADSAIASANEPTPAKSKERDGIAIIGMAGRFPGASTIEEFWSNLRQGLETISSFTVDQLAPGEEGTNPDYVPRRGILEKPEYFDAAFFAMSPKEAEVTDPQQRVFLETAWEAFERAGHDPSRIQGPVGVYAGMSNNSYYLRHVHHNQDLRDLVGSEAVMIGNEKDYLATRVAYKLNLRGPALNIYTACSTSLVAVCQACQGLWAGECEMALAGGVSVKFPQERGYVFEEGSLFSPDGHCRAFDEQARGTVFSNGVGIVVLKRLDDALRDGDQVYAVIKGTGVNNDGSGKVSFTAPSVDGQAEAVRLAVKDAGVDPSTIQYVETHGTGTPLGDPIEVAALAQVYGQGQATRRIGSLKSNIGHLDAAAGVAGLIKATLAMHHHQIPASLHFTKPNSKLNLEKTPFEVVSSLVEWPESTAPRRAGVTSLGIGGTNAHLILEEAPVLAASGESRPQQLILLSAKTEAGLENRRQQLTEHLRVNPTLPLADVTHTLQVGRQAFVHRLMVTAANTAEAVERLVGQESKHILRQRQEQSERPIYFMFPGQGAQTPGMGSGLYQTEPVFREIIDQAAEILVPILKADLRDLLYRSGDNSEVLIQTRITQPALFATEYALARLWMSWGILPAAMIGHSVGEYVAATIAGVFEFEDALKLVAKRAELVQAMPPGGMLAVRQPLTEIASLLGRDHDIAAVNSSALTVISGPLSALDTLEVELRARGIAAKRLNTSHAFHSQMMAPVLPPFTEFLRQVSLKAPRIPYVSNVSGEWVSENQTTSPEYWAGHVRQTVRFADGVEKLLTKGSAILLEVGPGSTLTAFAGQHSAKKAQSTVLASLSQTQGDASKEQASIAQALGRLWLEGAAIDWTAYRKGEIRRRVLLPSYPFERQRFCAPELESVEPVAAKPISLVMAEASETLEVPAVTTQAEVPVVNRETLLAKEIIGQLSKLSGTDAGEMDPAATFLDLGFDSLFLTQASLVFKKHFGLRITFRQLMENLTSVNALAEHLDQQLPPDRFRPSVAVEPATAPAKPEDDRLSTMESALKSLLKTQRQGQAAATNGAGQSSTDPAKKPGIRVRAQDIKADKKMAFGPFRPIEKSQDGALTPRQKSHLEDLIQRYNSRTRGSKDHVQKYRRALADPRAVAGFNPLWKDMVYPVVANRSDGGKIWDVDGNEYVDVTLGFGLSLFGHRPPFVLEAISRQLSQGFEIGPSTPLAGEVADLMRELSGMDRVSFCNTGSEAVTAALRIARTVTGRDKIVTFAGDYHGIFDEVLVRPLMRDGELFSKPIAPGIPESMVENIIVLEYGNPEALEVIREHADSIAAVLVEPVQSRRPELQPVEFLREIRSLTEEKEIALIFDEVVTGFRCHLHGAQGKFGIRADIVTYGKVIGGGLPIGVVAGKAAYMDALDGGHWQYGDDSFPEVGVTFFAGTFVRHPLALAAARACLRFLKANSPQLQNDLDARTIELVDHLNGFSEQAGVPIKVTRFSSLYFFNFAPELKFASLLFYHMRLRGIHIWESRGSFLSTAHTAEDIKRIKWAFEESVKELQAGGFFPGGAEMQSLISPFGLSETGASTAASTVVNQLKSVLTQRVSVKSQANGHAVALNGSAHRYPLTSQQEELFLASQMSDQASAACNESISILLDGELSVPTLQEAVNQLVARHDALRTRFDADGMKQEVQSRVLIEMPLVDLSSLEPTERDDLAAQCMREEIGQVFSLTRGPLFRAVLIKLSPQSHRLLLVAHHIICDGWSFDLLLNELGPLYQAASSQAEAELPAASQYREYAEDLRAFEVSPDYQETRDYWLQQFPSTPPVLELPTDYPRPSRMSYRAGTARAELSRELSERLQQFCKQANITPYAVMLAAYHALLSRLSGQNDIVIGAPIAGQPSSGMPKLCGHCVQFLPMRLKADETIGLGDYLARVKSIVLDSMDHQQYTLGHLMKELKATRDTSRASFVGTTFTLEPEGSEQRFAGITARAQVGEKSHTAFDLSLFVVAADSFRLTAVFNEALFEQDTIDRWLGHYETLLKELISKPADTSWSSLELLRPEEKQRIVSEWNLSPFGSSPEACVHQLFEEQAARNPGKIALLLGEYQLTYGELNSRANQLAHYLRSRGIKPNQFVGVFLERSFDLVVALLATLKAGGAYLPIDPGYPEDRIRFMLSDTKVSMVLTQRHLRPRLSRDLPEGTELIDVSGSLAAQITATEGLPCVTKPSDLAYLIYTSGSTGSPKGVMVPHRGVVRLVKNTNYARLGGDEVFLQAAAITFDASTFELWGPLLNGGTLAIMPPGVASLAEIGAAIKTHGVTTLWLTAGLFQVMVEEHLEDLKPLLQLLAGGDVLPKEHVSRALKVLPGKLINGYGPTENTTFTCCHTISESDLDLPSIPIGRPIANTQVYIVDSRQQIQPIGVWGELLIGGDGLATGYYNHPELTREKFIRDPFSKGEAKLYRSGDLCRWLPDGTIEFRGRIDKQLKIRGFRVEPGEIESVLVKHSSVLQCVVAAHGATASDKTLVAYVVLLPGAPADREAIRAYLQARLPEYLVPSALVILSSLPVTANGKVDYAALPAPGGAEKLGYSEMVPPRTELEIKLANIWREVLQRDQVSLNENFFDMGGHSLLGLKLFTRLQKELGVNLPLGTLFRAPTLGQLAAEVDQRVIRNGGEALPSTVIGIQRRGSKTPVFCVHGGDGGTLFYRDLAAKLTNDRPFFAIEAPMLIERSLISADQSIEETAELYIKQLRATCPRGPYILGGYSFGGIVAYEMAQQLRREGENIEMLLLFDTPNPVVERQNRYSWVERAQANWKMNQDKSLTKRITGLAERVSTGVVSKMRHQREVRRAQRLLEEQAEVPEAVLVVQIREAHTRAMEAYTPKPYTGSLTLFRAQAENDLCYYSQELGWEGLVEGGITVLPVPGSHLEIFQEPNLSTLAAQVRQALAGQPFGLAN